VLVLAPAAQAAGAPVAPQVKQRQKQWRRSFQSAERYARARLGRVSFALVDDGGTLRRSHGARRYRSASVVKAMLLVSYLNRRGIRNHRLDFFSRAVLRPMITRSANDAATRVHSVVGHRGLARLARRAGMTRFATRPAWGDTQITAADQARFFVQIDRLVPRRHRRYARRLLRSIVGPQRWGIPRGAPRGTRIFFKGGWRPADGVIVHQVALVERGRRRVSLAVLTDRDRSYQYGHETVRGIAKRVLRPLARR
jgi:hypothetical protein